MEKYYCRLFFVFLNLLLILLPPVSLSIPSSPSLPPPPPKCHEDEQSALMELKEGFGPIDSYDPEGLYNVKFEPWKLDSWKVDGGDGNCCTWDGVECEAESGHVIGLDLCCTALHASINSSSGLFRLVHLQKLNLAFTHFNMSLIPSAIGHLPRLKSLNLSMCEFTGQIPQQILGLTNLSSLDLSRNNGLELVKPSLRDLAMSLTKLEELDLSVVRISSPIPHALTNLSSLTSLTLIQCGLQGQFPLPVFSIHHGNRLKSLVLDANDLSGELPASINNLTELIRLSLQLNRFLGPMPSFANMTHLRHLFLSDNMLSGTVHLDKLLELKHLEALDLALNNLSVFSKSNMTTIRSSKLTLLGLGSCNLREFPELLLNLQRLSKLDLSSNNIHGQVPIWFQNVRRRNLTFLDLSRNSLTGFEGNSANLKWENLECLDLSFNDLQGPLPLPPEHILFYSASNNRLSGNIPPLLCQRRFIQVLDLANNNFAGVIPPCIGNLSTSLTVLSLRNNNLKGGIPQVPDEKCSIQMLELSDNQLQGPLPRTLSRCTNLALLNVGDNMIEDTFPSWLGAITRLRALSLRSNRFYGAIEEPKTSSEFQSLQIIDISGNNFQNYLPAKYFQYWTSMKEPILGPANPKHSILRTHMSSLTITNKGLEMEYKEILVYLEEINFSGNNFSGEIPESIANLKGLCSLNLSNNNLSGPIPQILGSLTSLESLDLSGNRLSGEIPPQLTELNFLEFFNVSNNQLLGHIPRGRQFNTFKNTSYEGNEGLCGVPLSRTCGSVPASPPASSSVQKEDSDAPLEIEWKAVVVGYLSSFAIAAVVGHKIITSRPDWFSRAFSFMEGRRRLR